MSQDNVLNYYKQDYLKTGQLNLFTARDLGNALGFLHTNARSSALRLIHWGYLRQTLIKKEFKYTNYGVICSVKRDVNAYSLDTSSAAGASLIKSLDMLRASIGVASATTP
ncbi:MAG: hypothetical protein WC307_06175 [Candidatus Nanoarchaeia archaeon]